MPHDIGLLSANTRSTLEALDVDVLKISEITFHQYIKPSGSPYLHGNKIDACREFTIEGNNLLIDTDTFVLNNLQDLLQVGENLAGSIARGMSCSLFKEENTELLRTIVEDMGDRFDAIKYYNSGVVFYNSSSNFQSLWSDITHKILNRDDIQPSILGRIKYHFQ